MSSFSGDLGDAVRSDGTLKDASKIVWNYDADDSIPFPSEVGSTSHLSSSSTSEHGPATVVAAVHRTTCKSRPSWRVLEELEAAEVASSAPASKSSGIKRKAASTLSNCRVMRKVIDISDGDSDDGSPTLPPTEPASDDYESLKAMADADNRVCAHQLLFLLPSHLYPRLRPPNPGRRVLLMSASSSCMRRDTFIQLPRRL